MRNAYAVSIHRTMILCRVNWDKPSVGTSLILRKLVHIEINFSCCLSCCEGMSLILSHMFNCLTFGGQLKPNCENVQVTPTHGVSGTHINRSTQPLAATKKYMNHS